MPKVHRVREGDCISSIALRYGFINDVLWDHPENAEVKELRGDPDVLLPGDKIHIPDLRKGEEKGAAGKRHRFRRKSVPAKFTLQLLDGDDPRPDLAYRFEVDGKLREGKTNGDGVLEEFIPADARDGTLFIDETEERYKLKFGGLAPVTEKRGVQERLENLSYLRPKASKNELDTAVIHFKEDHCGLEVKRDGTATEKEVESYPKLDDATRDKLVEIHGS